MRNEPGHDAPCADAALRNAARAGLPCRGAVARGRYGLQWLMLCVRFEGWMLTALLAGFVNAIVECAQQVDRACQANALEDGFAILLGSIAGGVFGACS